MINGLSKKASSFYKILFWGVIFSFLFVFLSRIHPVQAFDGDDWTYIGYSRDALPDADAWNPTRIFPEIFMPAVGFISAYFVTPILGNYLDAITVTYAFSIALFITLYLFAFYRMASKWFQLHDEQALTMTLLFCIMHFWIFRSNTEGNIHLFLSRNLTCYFYYTIPVLLNALLVMEFETKPEIWQLSNPLMKGILLLLIYLAVYSNMFSSIVIIAYSGAVLLREVIVKAAYSKKICEIKTYIRSNLLYIGIIIAWIISLGFELQGGRADMVGTGGAAVGIVTAAANLWNSFKAVNRYFLTLFVIVYILAAILVICSKGKNNTKDESTVAFLETQFRFWISAIVVAVFQILLCGVTSLTGYISCADVLISILFFVLAAFVNALTYILTKLPSMEMMIPILLCVALFNCHTFGKTYENPNLFNGSSFYARAITNSIIAQIYEADAAGLSEVEIIVPKVSDKEDGWPLPIYLGERMSRTLYEHGQINNAMNITVRIDESLNEKYGIK